MLRRLLARLYRRPEVVVVDADAYRQCLEAAVVGEALRILLDAERRWLLLDTRDAGPRDD